MYKQILMTKTSFDAAGSKLIDGPVTDAWCCLASGSRFVSH